MYPVTQEYRGAAGQRDHNHTCSLGVQGSLMYYICFQKLYNEYIIKGQV